MNNKPEYIRRRFSCKDYKDVVNTRYWQDLDALVKRRVARGDLKENDLLKNPTIRIADEILMAINYCLDSGRGFGIHDESAYLNQEELDERQARVIDGILRREYAEFLTKSEGGERDDTEQRQPAPTEDGKDIPF